jgi:hypothetical protein
VSFQNVQISLPAEKTKFLSFGSPRAFSVNRLARPLGGDKVDYFTDCPFCLRVYKMSVAGGESMKSKTQSGTRLLGIGQVGQLQSQVSRIRRVAKRGIELDDPRSNHAFEFRVKMLHSFGRTVSHGVEQ